MTTRPDLGPGQGAAAVDGSASASNRTSDNFTLKADIWFTWRVNIAIPEDKAHVIGTVNMEFNMLPFDRALEAIGTDADDAFFHEIVIGWDKDDVRDKDGAPTPFSREVLAKLIAIPYVRRAIFRAYIDAASRGRLCEAA